MSGQSAGDSDGAAEAMQNHMGNGDGANKAWRQHAWDRDDADKAKAPSLAEAGVECRSEGGAVGGQWRGIEESIRGAVTPVTMAAAAAP